MSFSISNQIIDPNNYEIVKFIGKGGFGVVFLAKDKNNGDREVAFKVIPGPFEEGSAKHQQSIIREISIPSHLKLQGIVNHFGFRFPLTDEEKQDVTLTKPFSYLDFGGLRKPLDLSGAIIVSEYMPNGSLERYTADYIKNNGKSRLLNPTIRSKILFGVAATMKRLHSVDILHRDLKLENIFLDENVEPRIADFGFAKMQIVGVQNTMAIGTPYYMAPELLNDTENYDGKVDVYAFAMLMYLTFSTTIEFQGFKKPIRAAQQYLMQISRQKRPQYVDSIPPKYWDLIEQCWKHDPHERPDFEQITEMMRSDEFAIKEYGQTTNLDELHEYWERIDPKTIDHDFFRSGFNYSSVSISPGKSVKMKDRISSFIPKRKVRKTNFNWKRH